MRLYWLLIAPLILLPCCKKDEPQIVPVEIIQGDDPSVTVIADHFENMVRAVEPHAAKGDCAQVLSVATQYQPDGMPLYAKVKEIRPTASQEVITRLETAQAKIRPLLEKCTNFKEWTPPLNSCPTSGCPKDCESARKWYNCAYSYTACLAGDNTECCWAGACSGSQAHCELVCKDSCECDVPPEPPEPPDPE